MTQQQAVLFLQCPISRGLAQMIRTSREWRAVSVGPFLGERDTCSSCGVEIRLKEAVGKYRETVLLQHCIPQLSWYRRTLYFGYR